MLCIVIDIFFSVRNGFFNNLKKWINLSIYKLSVCHTPGFSLTLCLLIDSTIWSDTINMEWCIVFKKGSQVRIFKLRCTFQSQMIVLILPKQYRSDEM